MILYSGVGLVPTYFQPEEVREVDPDPPDPAQVKGAAGSCNKAPLHILTARLNQIARFSVNYLTTSTQDRYISWYLSSAVS